MTTSAADLLVRPVPVRALALLGGGLVALAVAFCIVHAWLTAQSASIATSAAWATSILIPWLLVLESGKRQMLRTGRLDFLFLAAALAAAFAVSVGIQAAYQVALMGDAAIESIAWRRLPAMALVALPLITAEFMLRRREACPPADDIETGPGHLCQADWVKGAGNYVEARIGERTQVIRLSMERCERLLGKDFVRVHRSTIVRCTAIVGLEKDGKGTLVRLRDGSCHRVGDRYRHRIAD